MRSLSAVLLVLVSACDFGPAHPESGDERAHVFHEDNAFYVQHPEKAIFQADGYSSEPYRFGMRPVGAVLAIPKNHLVVVTHQYQPWAKKIYDVASIVATLPHFGPRTRENSAGLMNSASQDRLSITLGGLAGDLSASQYQEGVSTGALILDTRRSFPDMPVYRKSFDTAGTEPFFALPNPAKFTSPLGNGIVIVCPAHAYPETSQLPINDCKVRIALPPSHFPHTSADQFGGVAGVQLEYRFNEKYLPQWPAVHARVLDFVSAAILR